ncbi:MAG: sigma factor-like helix-turn-helix DNA-binding protein [Acidobacteriaceae bacterium]
MATFSGKRIQDESWLHAAEDGSSAILALPDFERFVYVLSVLEGCTNQECATLLGVSPQQIEETRLRALQHFWKR